MSKFVLFLNSIYQDKFLKRRKLIQFYSFLGRSGTGKSFCAQWVAQKYQISAIIDDGLLIFKKKVLCGLSAKKSKNAFEAIRISTFDSVEHREEIKKSIIEHGISKILVLGTSFRMIMKIIHRIGLGYLYKVIYIEDVCDKENIQLAIQHRKNTNEHVIPLSYVEILKLYPNLASTSLSIVRNKKYFSHKYQKTIVKPKEIAHQINQNSSSNSSLPQLKVNEVLEQMVLNCIYEYDPHVEIEKITWDINIHGYIIEIYIRQNKLSHMFNKNKVKVLHMLNNLLTEYAKFKIYKIYIKNYRPIV